LADPTKRLLLALALMGAAAAHAVPACPPAEGVALQVLGSGGPVADDGRASSGYLVWIDGRARVLIDAGGGTFLRFGEAGARFADLDFVGISHFHTDHSADFVALLKSGFFSGRERPLALAGPGGSSRFPGLSAFLARMLAPGEGAYHYLGGYLDGSGGLARLEPQEVDVAGTGVRKLLDDTDRDLRVTAMPVPHGIVPALGFRIDARGRSIVFASDQNGSAAGFAGFAADADLLVMHMPIAEGATGGALELHAEPGRIGSIASDARAKSLVLSHFMARSLRDLQANVDVVRGRYGGETVVAEDLLCLVAGPSR
jgi:ribonuclease BN (tRNA processing enzyme)